MELRYFAVKSFPGHEKRKSLMSPGLLLVACLVSGSGRSALLTINLPQTEILTYQIFIYAIYIRESYLAYFLLDRHPYTTELWIPEVSFLLQLWIPLLSPPDPSLTSLSVCLSLRTLLWAAFLMTCHTTFNWFTVTLSIQT